MPIAVTRSTKVAEDAVPVTEQIARCRLPRKGFSKLLGGPFNRRVSGHTDVKNATSVVGQYQEDVQDLEADGWDREEVD